MQVRTFLLPFLCAWLCSATTAQAQMADVPNFDENGDFITARVRGNRGTYPHRQWLVIEPDRTGLNCRNSNGDIVVTLAYGAVVDSAFHSDDAISRINGSPWLKVNANVLDVRHIVVNEAAVNYTCYVRANNQYITPINPDTQ
ncbi:hypothetical protein [Leptothoe kymatousa]|uniref:Uncharacterized protein n=1 Tax=Leptothoe kymatousa TAU-MAC 1615 TaxID=2364775 RepID=A0ABS5Y1R0_9CYAN|nr:hypothetical protein [Leptothoe kymatousa]MBT9311763.1 hypothetical protein [Leptothoe kymatousa TAU-MAC 1615]